MKRENRGFRGKVKRKKWTGKTEEENNIKHEGKYQGSITQYVRKGRRERVKNTKTQEKENRERETTEHRNR